MRHSVLVELRTKIICGACIKVVSIRQTVVLSSKKNRGSFSHRTVAFGFGTCRGLFLSVFDMCKLRLSQKIYRQKKSSERHGQKKTHLKGRLLFPFENSSSKGLLLIHCFNNKSCFSMSTLRSVCCWLFELSWLDNSTGKSSPQKKGTMFVFFFMISFTGKLTKFSFFFFNSHVVSKQSKHFVTLILVNVLCNWK